MSTCESSPSPQFEQGWGLTYSRFTWDGQEYSDADWRLTWKEPLAEICQIKGAQECALAVRPTKNVPGRQGVRNPGEPRLRPVRVSCARARAGLELDQVCRTCYGLIPRRTDSHNANPDVEEWDFPGNGS